REAALVDGDFLFDFATRGLIGGELFFGVGDPLAGRVDSRVERLFLLGRLGETPLRSVRGGVELLQMNYSLKIRIHALRRPVLDTPDRLLPPPRLRRDTFACGASGGWWAHQDSNLERAGYEPAALTIELWARSRVYSR